MIDTNIDFIIEGDTIDLVTDFGQTVTEIKSPETYTGQTTVTPSTTQQILQTKNKLVTENVSVEPAPLGVLDVDENGTYRPVDVLGFSEVNVDVEKLGVLIKTETLDHDEAQERGDPFFWYNYFNLGAGIFFLFFDNNGYLNTNYNSKAIDMICFVTSPDAKTQSLVISRNGYKDPRNTSNSWCWASAGTKIRVYQIPYNL